MVTGWISYRTSVNTSANLFSHAFVKRTCINALTIKYPLHLVRVRLLNHELFHFFRAVLICDLMLFPKEEEAGEVPKEEAEAMEIKEKQKTNEKREKKEDDNEA